MAEYGNSEYWEERYKKDTDSFDWFQRYDGFKEYIEKHLKTADQILQIGCGNSRLAEEMYQAGFVHQTNIDISPVTIETMQKKYEKYAEVKWVVQDCEDLSAYADGFFDGCVDKATMDSLLCGNNGVRKTSNYLKEVSRVLKPGGALILISYAHADWRLPYLEVPELKWTVDHFEIAKPDLSLDGSGNLPEDNGFHHVYVCVKDA